MMSQKFIFSDQLLKLLCWELILFCNDDIYKCTVQNSINNKSLCFTFLRRSRYFIDVRVKEHISQTTCLDLSKFTTVTPFSVVDLSAADGVLLNMGMMMTSCSWLLSYPVPPQSSWLSLLSSLSIIHSENPSLDNLLPKNLKMKVVTFENALKNFLLDFVYFLLYGRRPCAGSCYCCCFVLCTCRYCHCKIILILNTRASATDRKK